MSGGLFGGYNKLQNAVYSRIDEANAIRLEKAAREYSDYMKNAYRLMNDPNLREIAERRIGDTAIPSAMRTASRETGEMNFGNVLGEKPGTVSAEQMYGVKLSQENKNEDFAEWNESNKKQAQIDGERVNALSLKERLTMIVNNVFPKTLPHVKLGEIPTAVKATIGIDSDVPLVMSKDKARAVMISKSKAEAAGKNENRNWHGLGTDGLEKVVAALENPLRAVKQENGRYGFVVKIEEGGKPFYVAIELDTNANYRGKMEKANVVVSAFGTDFNYVKNQITKGTELEIKKEPVSQVTHGRQLPNGVNETDSNGDVPSPNANIPQNGNGVNTLDAENSAAKAQQNSENAAKVQQRKPGTVSAEQMYGVKLSQENRNEDFAEWAEKEDAKKKKAAEGADKSSYVNTDTTGKTEEQIRVMEEFKNAIEPEVIEFVKEAENNPSDRWKKKDMGTVSERAANDIKNATGVDVSNFRHSMDVDFVSHVEKRHGKSGIQDHSMANVNDIARIGYVLENYDSITKGNLSPKYKNNDGSYAQTIVYEKAVDGSFYVVEAVPDSKAKKLRLITAYISKKTPSAQVAHANKSRESTPETSLHTDGVQGDVPSPNANIPQNGNSVNTLDVENSAAKAQQTETEEEARLRTLYESEPTGKYAGTEAGESKAELDEKVKEAKENAVGNDELKEKPKTEKQKILKRRIEKAGLDMTVEEIVGFAQGLGRIKGFFGSERKDFARIFDDVSEGSRTIRNDLHKLLEVPHRQAQAQYTESYKNAVKAISDKFAELGIKAGSKESAAVQRIGEHAYQIDSKGNTAEYTYEMLERDFPDSWEKIAEAAKFTRNIYDDYLKKLNAMYESIYPQTVEKAEERRSKLNAEAQRMSDYKDSLNEVKKALRENVDKKKAALAKSKDGTQKKADLKRQIATLEARMKVVDSKMAAADSRAFAAKLKSEKQKILKRRIEKAGLDMTVEEIVGFAQGLGRIKGFFGSERKDFARIFDDVSEGSRTIRNDLHKLLEVPHRQAQANSIGSESKYHQLFYSCRKIHFVISRTVSSMGRGW